MSRETPVPLDFEGERLEGRFVGRRDRLARPTVMLIPTVMGVSPLEIGFGRQLVELGYNAFVADLFGVDYRGAERAVMFERMNALKADRVALRRRLEAVVDQASGLAEVDRGQLAVAGYCFGGLCALDIARSGADVCAAASFHGLLDPPGWAVEAIRAKVVVFHGWDDPLAPPATVLALGQELSEAGADWQIHAFGGVGHSFTNPAADGSTPGLQYDALTAERSWTGFISLLEEVFG